MGFFCFTLRPNHATVPGTAGTPVCRLFLTYIHMLHATQATEEEPKKPAEPKPAEPAA